MAQMKILFRRLANPTVLASIISEIIILLTAHVGSDELHIFATSISTILITLGIMSNPDTQNKTFLDDIRFCKGCSKDSEHTFVNGKMLCKDCGYVFEEETVEE